MHGSDFQNSGPQKDCKFYRFCMEKANAALLPFLQDKSLSPMQHPHTWTASQDLEPPRVMGSGLLATLRKRLKP